MQLIVQLIVNCSVLLHVQLTVNCSVLLHVPGVLCHTKCSYQLLLLIVQLIAQLIVQLIAQLFQLIAQLLLLIVQYKYIFSTYVNANGVNSQWTRGHRLHLDRDRCPLLLPCSYHHVDRHGLLQGRSGAAACAGVGAPELEYLLDLELEPEDLELDLPPEFAAQRSPPSRSPPSRSPPPNCSKWKAEAMDLLLTSHLFASQIV